MTDTAAAEALFRDLNRRFDRLDVLVNNAGSGSMNAIALTPVDVAPFGVTCNAVGPCPIRTKLTASVPAAKIQALIDRQAVRRWGAVEDVVNVVEFFLRPESGMVTGQVIYLGGAG